MVRSDFALTLALSHVEAVSQCHPEAIAEGSRLRKLRESEILRLAAQNDIRGILHCDTAS
jgi:hypothetical protein